MTPRFRRSIKIAPGIKLSLGKKDGSFSFGPQGPAVTVGRGGTFANPGAGLLWGSGSSRSSGKGMTTAKQQPAVNVATLPREANLYNTAVEEGINQHRKIPSPSEVLSFKDAVKHICGEDRITLKVILHIVFAPFALAVALFSLAMAFTVAQNDSEQIVFAGIGIILTVYAVIRIRQCIRFGKNEKRVKADYAQAIEGDQEAIGTIFEALLKNIDWFRETTPAFEVSPDGKTMYVDIDFPEIEHMPDCTMAIKKTEQAMHKSFKEEDDISKDYSTHVHGIIMRIAGLCFAFLPTVDTVLCSGYTQHNNYIISVSFDRAQWAKTSPSGSVPENFIEQFQYRREFGEKGVLKTIMPLSPDACKAS